MINQILVKGTNGGLPTSIMLEKKTMILKINSYNHSHDINKRYTEEHTTTWSLSVNKSSCPLKIVQLLRVISLIAETKK